MMAAYSDVVVLRHPQPGAVSVSVTRLSLRLSQLPFVSIRVHFNISTV